MAEIRKLSRVLGSIFDVTALAAIPADDCHVIFVSGRTLYIMQHIANNEVNWLARYADSFTDDGIWYTPVDLNSANIDLVEGVARDYRNEVNDVDCTVLAEGITAIVDQLAALTTAIMQNSCGCVVGQGTDNEGGEIEGTPPGPVGDIEMSSVTMSGDRSCQAANWILDNLLALFTYLHNQGIDNLSGVTLTLMIELIAVAIGASVGSAFGALLGAIAGLVIAFSTQVLTGDVDFSTIADAFNDYREEIICAMFSGLDVDSIRAALYDILENDAGLTGANLALAELCLPNLVLNHLFFTSNSGAESEIQATTSEFDCSTECDAIVWDWDDDAEGWSHTDQSDACAVGSGSWGSAGILTNVLQTDGSANCNAQSSWKLSGLSISVSEATLFAEHSAPSDSDDTGYTARIYYNGDASYVEQQVVQDAKGTVQVTLSGSQTISSVELIAARTNGAGGGPSYNLFTNWRYAKLIWS